jgi:hypothetical protein
MYYQIQMTIEIPSQSSYSQALNCMQKHMRILLYPNSKMLHRISFNNNKQSSQIIYLIRFLVTVILHTGPNIGACLHMNHLVFFCVIGRGSGPIRYKNTNVLSGTDSVSPRAGALFIWFTAALQRTSHRLVPQRQTLQLRSRGEGTSTSLNQQAVQKYGL